MSTHAPNPVISEDSVGVHAIANTERHDRRADIVFVHGLAGGSHSTWRFGIDGHPAHFFWPSELAQDLRDCGVWSLGYEAGMSHWFSDEGLAIDDRAANLALKLASNELAQFGNRPLIFIAHSMGGLVIKEFVTGALSLGGQNWNAIAKTVRGIIFLGTPHHGSHMASVAKGFSHLLRTQEHLRQMRFAGSTLDRLHRSFVKWQNQTRCSVESYIETRGIARNGFFGRLLPRVLVVPRISSDPRLADCDCHPITTDHIALVKPLARTSDVYAGVLRFVKRTLDKATIAAALSETGKQQPTRNQPLPDPSVKPGEYAASATNCHADISRIVEYAPAELIGREAETKLLNDAWAKVVTGEIGRPHVLTFVALGGEGKTSLVAKWAAEVAGQDWPGCDAAFAWSFYSQGTREQVAASSDLFLKEALTFFGDDADREFAASPAGAHEKGQHLARIVGQRRCLLILDGLEPLQYAPTSPTPGDLKDQGIAALLKGLAGASQGLCVVTTRYSVPNLKAFRQTTAPEVKLLRLSRAAGVHLLQSFDVKGSLLRNIPFNDGKEQVNEFEKLVEDVKGHALTLTLLGGFLKRAFHGDIRQRDRVNFEKADEKIDGGHAFRTIAAYEKWLMRDGGDEGQREVAVLRLLGLFDRPAAAGCLAALRSVAIPGLTEPLAGLADEDWEFCLSGLEATKLLTVNRDSAGVLVSLDAHPHLREYFAKQVRDENSDGWRAAHQKLYEHLYETTPNKPLPTLEDLQPLYQAVAHGCQAGLQQEACDNVYRDRIEREHHYGKAKLGAFGSDLGAIACFFDPPWKRVSPALVPAAQAWLSNEAAYSLRALGRLTEALEPIRTGLPIEIAREDWKNANRRLYNLSELELTLGEVIVAVEHGEQAVKYADLGGDAFERMSSRSAHADALHQAGRRSEAEMCFREAKKIQAEHDSAHPLLYSVAGFRYCDLLVSPAERAVWQAVLGNSAIPLEVVNGATRAFSTQDQSENTPIGSNCDRRGPLLESCRSVSQRTAQTLAWVESWGRDILSAALDHLTLGRTALYLAILERSDFRLLTSDLSNVETAVEGLRRASMQHMIPLGLLTRAWLRFLTSGSTGTDSAQSDLDEAWEIAERGPMPLFMADVHLHRARLFFSVSPYPWAQDPNNPDGPLRGPKDDLAAARKLIEKHGYWRRKEELEYAEEAAKNW